MVVGAGTGGLAAAGGLARAGWRVTLLERDDRLRPGPAALLLWPGGVRALRTLDLGGGLAAFATPIPDPGLRRPDGQWLARPRPATADGSRDASAAPDPPAEVPLLAHAEDLHDALVAGVGDRVEIRTSVTAGPVAGDRPAVTDGHRTWDADLVVAADGIDSALRPTVAPASTPVAAGATVWRAVLPWYRAQDLSPDPVPPVLTDGGGYRFRVAALGLRSRTGTSGRGGIYWAATGPGAPRPEPADTQLELLGRWFAGWHPPVGELLSATGPDDLVQQELRTLRPPPKRLFRTVGPGAVVLLGEAGHAVADHLGQGACLALEDAATLADAVSTAMPGPELHAAVAAYDRARRSRTARVRRRASALAGRGPFARTGLVRARRLSRAAATAAAWRPAA